MASFPNSYPPYRPGWSHLRASLFCGPDRNPVTTLHLLLLTLPFASPFLVPPLTAFSPSCAGPGGEHIPHVECVSQTLLRVNQWDPEGNAEILIFGRPSYQKDVSKMIMNLAYYHRQLRAQSTGPGIVRGNLGRPWGS